MIEELKSYAGMKDCRVAWLAQVPAHWDVRRLKMVFREVDHRTKTGEETLLSLRMQQGLVDHHAMGGKPIPPSSLVNYKITMPGEIVMNRMRAAAGLFAATRVIGLVSPDYAVLCPRVPVHLQYFVHLFRTPLMMSTFRLESRGLGTGESGFLRLYTERFGMLVTPLPPLTEQAAIVRFLNHADRRIRRYVQAKQKLIKLLEEQKQAIVHRAVTRGLDPDVRLKPSGVAWLGDVPEHWEVSRVKTEFHCLNRHRVPLSSTQRGAMTSRRYDYYGASSAIDKVDDFLFDDDLLLIAEDGANLVLRNLPLAIIARGKFWVNNHAHILKPKRGNLEYLAAVMETLNYLPWISGAAQPKLTQDRLLSIAVAVPPRAEQDSIIAGVETETAPLRAAICAARIEVNLLREYRTRLITDVVTGKLDVREAAARLPDEAEEAESLDDAAALADGDDETEDTDKDENPEEAEA